MSEKEQQLEFDETFSKWKSICVSIGELKKEFDVAKLRVTDVTNVMNALGMKIKSLQTDEHNAHETMMKLMIRSNYNA